MPKYLCLQRHLPVQKNQQPTPTDMQEIYAQYGAWMEKFKGNLTDMGGKLGAGKLVAAEPPTDGPIVEVAELVGGYMIVSADSIDEAITIARGCPGLVRPGAGVEVIEIHTS